MQPSGIVLALGAGGARGLAHIGVLQVLAEQGISVRAIAGASIGAQVGALYARLGDPVQVARIALAVDWKQTLQLFLPDLGAGGLSSGRKITEFLETHLGEARMEDLPLPFTAVATDLHSGEEVLLRHGSVVAAVRASISLPGLLSPFAHGERLLVDGGIVNPVPFDVARALYGAPVVAVAVHEGARGLSAGEMTPLPSSWRTQLLRLLDQPWAYHTGPVRQWLEEQLATAPDQNGHETDWHPRRVLTQAVNIAQAQVVRLRLQSAPPDLYLMPDVDAIGPLEFYRAREAIAAGRAAALGRLSDLFALANGHADAADGSLRGLRAVVRGGRGPFESDGSG
ncbi:MAG: patatin-like phospholipase family protein [Gammaproteobacteria bacterium]|nr:patatin-like phospholipase family protein [Gammaproteobacteria bacterium]